MKLTIPDIPFSSLKASQRLCEDFSASIDAARNIREDLQRWYNSLPDEFQLRPQPMGATPISVTPRKGVAVLNLSYLCLEVLLYRALLRPLGQASPPPPVEDDETNSSASDFQWFFENINIDHLTPLPPLETLAINEAAEVTIKAAEKCAAVTTNYLSRLASNDFDTFWHSCKLMSV